LINAQASGNFGGVKVKIEAVLLLVVALLAGCAKSTPPTPTTAAEESLDTLPTHAQAKLPTIKLYLGAETLDAEMAVTPKEEQTGMMFRTNIQETDAMIFPLPYPMQASFWMKNCPESISAAYITADGVIQEIHHLEHDDTNPVLAGRDDIQFVLETKEGWFIRHNVGVGTVIRTEKGSLADVFLRRQ